MSSKSARYYKSILLHTTFNTIYPLNKSINCYNITQQGKKTCKTRIIARIRHERMEAMFAHQCSLIDANIVGMNDCLSRRNYAAISRKILKKL
jgi:hypothetical protein